MTFLGEKKIHVFYLKFEQGTLLTSSLLANVLGCSAMNKNEYKYRNQSYSSFFNTNITDVVKCQRHRVERKGDLMQVVYSKFAKSLQRFCKRAKIWQHYLTITQHRHCTSFETSHSCDSEGCNIFLFATTLP
jgi:hypothetical protein